MRRLSDRFSVDESSIVRPDVRRTRPPPAAITSDAPPVRTRSATIAFPGRLTVFPESATTSALPGTPPGPQSAAEDQFPPATGPTQFFTDPSSSRISPVPHPLPIAALPLGSARK